MWKTSGGFSSNLSRSRWMYAYDIWIDPLVLEIHTLGVRTETSEHRDQLTILPYRST